MLTGVVQSLQSHRCITVFIVYCLTSADTTLLACSTSFSSQIFELLRNSQIKIKEIKTEILFGGFSFKTNQNREKAWTRKDIFLEKTPV